MAVDPKDQAQLNALAAEYVQLMQQIYNADQKNAEISAQKLVTSGKLLENVERLRKELNDTVFASDYLLKSFRETLAELKNQNVSLQTGRGIFKDLTNIAQDLTYFQRGLVDLEDKHFRKKQQTLKISKDNLEDLVKNLGVANSQGEIEYRREKTLNALLNLKNQSKNGLSKSQKILLDQLQKENELLSASKDALKEGVPTLQRELDISKQIYEVREDLGGLAGATAATISKYGGDLSRFLKIDDALESVRTYNQDIIRNALTNEKNYEQIKKFDEERDTALRNSLQVQNDLNDLLADQVRLEEIANELADPKTTLAQKRKLRQEESKLLASYGSVGDLQLKIDTQRIQVKQTEIGLAKDLKEIDEKEAAYKMEIINRTNSGLEGFKNKLKSLGVLVVGLGAGLRKALTDPITIIGFFLSKALEANKQSVETARSLGISADAASRLRDSYVDYAAASNDNFVTQTRLNKAQNELSKSLGIAVAFRRQDLETFARLTELMGLSSEEGAKIYKLATVTGKSYKGYANDVAEAAYHASVNTKQNITSREALQTISKLSAGILIKFQGNTQALVQNVAEAKKLGLTLDQIDKVGESLLNWEQSIENELKAELLTGRELNLERARAAALAGDQLSLTREIADQVGTLEDYQSMNVIAQKALAEAFGLSREEMSDMLLQQELINREGDKAAKLTKKQREEFVEAQKARPNLTLGQFLNEQQQQLDIQQKFNNAVVKLQELIGGLIEGPLGRLIDHLATGLNIISKIFGVFGRIGTAIRGLLGDKIGGKLGDIASVLAGGALLTVIASSLTRGTLVNPMVVAPVGGMGGMGGAGGFFGKGGALSKFLFPGAAKSTVAAGAGGAITGAGGATAGAAGAGAGGATGAAASTVGSTAAKVTLPSGSYTQGGQAFNAAGKQLSGAAKNSVMSAAAKQTAAASTAGTAGASASASASANAAAGGAGGAATGGVRGFFSNALKTIKNPASLFKGITVKSVLQSAKRISIISSLIEAIMASGDIQEIVDSGADQKTINQAVGKRVLEGLGGVLVGSALTALIGTVTGGMGFLASTLTYMGGDWVGRKLFGWLADTIGAGPVGEATISAFGFKPKAAETPELAVGGEVLQTGLAKVDAGEVYMGKSTRETFRLLAANSIAQTQYLRALITGFNRPSDVLNPVPIVESINSLTSKLINTTKPAPAAPTPTTVTTTTTTAGFDIKPFSDIVNKLLTTPLNINVATIVEAIKGIAISPSPTSTSQINLNPIVDAIKGISLTPTITNQINFNPLIDAIKGINITQTSAPTSQINLNPIVEAIKGINIPQINFNPLIDAIKGIIIPQINFNPLIDAIKGINIVSSTPSPTNQINFNPLIDAIKGITINPTSIGQINLNPIIEAIKGISIPQVNITPLIDAIKGINIAINPTVSNQVDFSPLLDAINKINIAPIINNAVPTLSIDFTPLIEAINKISIAPPQVNNNVSLVTPENKIKEQITPTPTPLPTQQPSILPIENKKPNIEQQQVNVQTSTDPKIAAILTEVKNAVNGLQNRPMHLNLYLDSRKITEAQLQATLPA